ncbi:hypothetical protein BDV37DRAFT_282873 [Aspergillus pseudonomiae]|uniref:Rhodopsin domain-containing protein n=1 Tax=Aspergillus pseudonomiae TaxID=1506151 RepID=A0A5N7DCY1_9EURO|nr:uncharacterized protein BDV37DRAFT_282873 [Aspergillus pseudonomiae]KAE8404326.1 hypothetical protein BDV37DRAFT_282873 [Aspergillus pseudonomiae]
MADNTTIPAMSPPPGTVSNFTDPPYIGTKFLVVNCVFLPIATIALLVRTWTWLFIVRSFRWDDYFMIVALVLSAAMTGVTLEMLNWGLGRHMWDVPADYLSPWFMKLNVIAAILYCAGTGFTKVSVLLFYMRIFPSRNFHLAVWAIVFVAAGYSVASILANVLSCSPIDKAWYPAKAGTCMNRPVFYFANAGLGIFTDFATVIVPIPWLRRLQMPLRQKIAVSCILAMGCFVGVVSCIRLSTLYTLLKSPDLTWSTTDALMWCTIELNLGITGGCITAVRPFVRRYFPHLLGLSYGNGYQSGSTSRKYGHPLGSVPRANAPDFSNTRSNQYSTNTTTTGMPAADNGSEEHILQYPEMPAKSSEGIGIVRTVEFDVENSSARR